MTTPNDVMVGKIRVSNLFSTRDEDWHNMSIKPIRGLYNMTRALDVEVHVNKVLEEFLGILDERFARGVNAGKVVDMADYIPYCKKRTRRIQGPVLTMISLLGLNEQHDFRKDIWHDGGWQ